MNLPTTIQAFRTFLPSKDWQLSRQFYRDIGGEESWVAEDEKMCLFRLGSVQFYLQDYYRKDWAENMMCQLLVEDVDDWWIKLDSLRLPDRYGVKIRSPFHTDWGSYEIHLHDPAGVLWFFARFND